jgi:hypothetical protein
MKLREIILALITMGVKSQIDDPKVDPCVTKINNQCSKCADGFSRLITKNGVYCGLLDERKKTCQISKFDIENSNIKQIDSKEMVF